MFSIMFDKRNDFLARLATPSIMFPEMYIIICIKICSLVISCWMDGESRVRIDIFMNALEGMELLTLYFEYFVE